MRSGSRRKHRLLARMREQPRAAARLLAAAGVQRLRPARAGASVRRAGRRHRGRERRRLHGALRSRRATGEGGAAGEDQLLLLVRAWWPGAGAACHPLPVQR
jgi:hypothetical protein